jgi:predicted porin
LVTWSRIDFFMKPPRRASDSVAVLLALMAAAPAAAIEYQFGEVEAELLLAAAAQGATYRDGPDGDSESDTDFLGLARLNLEWISDAGRVYGVRAEANHGTRSSEELGADELYAYFASELGRLELGRQDGAADVMSFHAPVMALGQIRGDFAEYVGITASLSPADTRDSPKLVYLSPPIRGLRFGVSYAPEFTVNQDATDPRRRIIQKDAIEAAAQYLAPLGNDWSLGASLAHVRGSADPQTERRDLSSWSTGLELRREELTIGAAYVDNGDSNDLTRVREQEWNAGVAWRTERWGAALSFARNESIPVDVSLFSIGGFYAITEHVVIRSDAVLIDESPRTGSGGNYHVLLLEVGVEL